MKYMCHVICSKNPHLFDVWQCVCVCVCGGGRGVGSGGKVSDNVGKGGLRPV